MKEVKHEEPPVVVTPPACIPADTQEVMRPSYQNGVLDFCTMGNDGDECWSYTVASDSLARRELIPVAEEMPFAAENGPHWALERPDKLSVCVDQTSCKPVKLPAKMGVYASVAPSANADGTQVIVTVAPDDQGPPTAVIYDVKSGKQLVKKKLGDESFRCGGATFLGNTVLVALDVCAGPGGQAYFASAKDLSKIAELGNGDVGQYDPQHESLGEGRYLFLEQGGRSVYVQDAATGKVLSKLLLADQFAKIEGTEEEGWDVPAYGALLWRHQDGSHVVFLQGSAMKVVDIDAQGASIVKVHPIPRCAATP